MPSFTPPIVANTDFNQWQNWERVTTPDGSTTYYVIPGYNGQYVFDPFTSNATGSITIYQNPKPAYDAAAKVQKQQEEAGSSSTQAAQIAGTAAGAALTGAAADIAKNGWQKSTVGGWFSSSTPAPTPAPSAAPTVAPAPSVAPTSAPVSGGSSAGSLGESGASAADIAAMKATDAAIANGASAADAAKAGEAAGAEAGGTGWGTAGKALQIAAYAYAAYEMGKTALDTDASKSERGKEIAKQAGLMVANYWTFGLASVANAALMQTSFGRKLDSFLKKHDYVSGILGQSLLHKSTKGYQKERLGELYQAGNKESAGYLNAARQQAEANENKWTEGKYAGESWTFDKALDLASQDPTHFLGVYANFQVAGDDWLRTPEEKQKEFVSRAIQEGLYTSEKGDVLFSGKSGALDRAKQLYGEVMSGQTPAPMAPPAPQQQAPQVQPQPQPAPAPQVQPQAQPQAPQPAPQQMSEEDKVKQTFLDMMNNKVRKGVGSQPNVYT